MFARGITTRGLNKAARLSARFFRYIYTYANAGSNVLCALCGWNGRSFYNHFDHVWACGLDYGDRFTAAGFKVRELRVKTLPKQSDTELYGLSASHVAWCCTKA